ncbi:hypothetical protein HYH03_009303 [Edaphochlamys debaryana]|uniref:Uncharacterized protein n=1 Tax=Edaphochlamys debaryana TaxID=47281 RepID=A0A836BXB5_9CHLO|nr:hypothetical protein HYH03_009303 [Edaphochlamys debaryana]|eukprot:KAG2492355.1 hypothetical protein HYH03_009303 [Edaphochlamys debaryana]
MNSDDEEAEIAVDIRRLWSVKVPLQSLGQKEPIKPVISSAKNKDPTVVSAHYDPDRRRLYYGLDNGAVCFWPLTESSPNTSRFVGTHKGPVTAIATPRKHDGDLGKAGLIVTGSVDSSIKIWDFQGKVVLDPTVCVQTLYGHSGTVTALVISGDYIVSSSTDGTIKMWRQEEGRGQLVYPWFELQGTVAGMEGWVRCLAFDSSGDVGDLGAIFAADESGGVTKLLPEAVWDDSIQRLSTRMEFKIDQRVERLHDRGISVIRYVAKWDLVLTIAFDQCLRAYDTKSGNVRHVWTNERGCQFTCIEVDLEFDEVLAGDTNGLLSIFSVRTGRLMVTKQLVSAPPGPRLTSAVAPAASSAPGAGAGLGVLCVRAVLGRQLYAVVAARELTLWRIEHELDYNVARGGHEKAIIGLYTCTGGVAGPSGDQDHRIFSASLDNTVRLWDPYDMACIRVMQEMSSEISAMTFYEGWNLLVTGHDNGDIRLWNLDTSHAVTLRQHANTVTALAMALVHRNEELLISASYDGWVVLWDIRSLRGEEPHMVARFRAHGPDAPGAPGAAGVAGVGASASASATNLPGSAGAGAGGVPGLGLGGAASGRGLQASGSAGSGGLTPPNGRAAGVGLGTGVAGAGAGAGAGGLVGGAARRLLSGAEPEILALKFDPLKKAIVTAGTDRVIKVWAATGYDYLGCHHGHREAVTCLALDSNFLFSGSDDCTICLWDIVPAGGIKTGYIAGRSVGGGYGAVGGGPMSVSGVPPPPGSAGGTPGSAGGTGPGPGAGASPPGYKAPFSSRPLRVLTGHTRSVTGLDVLPSSGNLVSCSLDGQLLVWDYVAGTVLHRFSNDTQEFRCLALRYDRPEVLVGTQQAALLRYTTHEAAVAAPGKGRASKGPGGAGGPRPSGSGGGSGAGLQGEMEGLGLGGEEGEGEG